MEIMAKISKYLLSPIPNPLATPIASQFPNDEGVGDGAKELKTLILFLSTH